MHGKKIKSTFTECISNFPQQKGSKGYHIKTTFSFLKLSLTFSEIFLKLTHILLFSGGTERDQRHEMG